MSENIFLSVISTASAAVAITFLLSTASCQKNQDNVENKTLADCVEKTQKPLECRTLIHNH